MGENKILSNVLRYRLHRTESATNNGNVKFASSKITTLPKIVKSLQNTKVIKTI
jgi:hypothetical protein